MRSAAQVGRGNSNIHFFERTPGGLGVTLRTDSPGILEIPALPVLVLGLHSGAASVSSCRHGGRSRYGSIVHGDIHILPPGSFGRWEIIKGNDCALTIAFAPTLLEQVAHEADVDPARIDFQTAFCLRDQQIENIAWALQAELQSGSTSGRLYTDSLATAIAARVLMRYSSVACPAKARRLGLSGYDQRRLVSYIEDNLAESLSLSEIASFAGYSASHLEAVFRQSVGVPIHEYVIRRRLDRAKTLLFTTTQSITEIALNCGFAHPSHMARHMKRIHGAVPREIRRNMQRNK